MHSVCVNPIIPGFAPDPSIVVIGATYFLVTSSFHLFPGLPIYASTDLCNWRHIGNAINRAEQLSLAQSGTNLKNDGSPNLTPATGGLYAPTIRHFRGRTYIVCTNVIHDPEDVSNIQFRNFIISTKDIWSNSWTNPIYFVFQGIDPSLYFDDTGRAYIQGSFWGSETTINCFEIDVETGTKLSEEKVIWNGFSKVIPEGPHLYACKGWFYLLVAEGGTHEGHQITIARSKSIWGPFESYEKNPILKPSHSSNPIQYTGHGDMFCDRQSNWWMVCLGARKIGDRCLFGRESFICPVTWTDDDWPCLSPPVMDPPVRFNQHGRHVQVQSTKVLPSSPSIPFVWLRHPDGLPLDSILSRDASGWTVSLKSLTTDIGDNQGPISFIGKRPRSYGLATVTFDIRNVRGQGSLKAGIAFYKDEHRYARIFWDSDTTSVVFEFLNRARSIYRTAFAHGLLNGNIRLSIRYGADRIELSVDAPGVPQSSPLGCIDVAEISDPDFVGPVVGVFASSAEDCRCHVNFHGFSVED